MDSKEIGPDDIHYQTTLETTGHLRGLRYDATYELAELLQMLLLTDSHLFCEMDTEQVAIIASELHKLKKHGLGPLKNKTTLA